MNNSRKVFVSVLGTGYYRPAKYYFNDQKDNFFESRFVQIATLRHFCMEWSEGDAGCFFLTEGAKDKNWDDKAQKGHKEGGYPGLGQEIKDLGLRMKVKITDIPDGNSESEIWEIFQRVYDELKEEDEVYFDITHAFRYIPMLLMTLIHYAKFLKNIKVASITYGNYEMGKDQAGFAPIVDLTSFSLLQDWSSVAQEFTNFGQVRTTGQVVASPIKELSKKYKGTNQSLLNLRKLLEFLPVIPENIYTCRAKNLYESKFYEEWEELVSNDIGDFFPPLKPLVAKIDNKIGEFDKSGKFFNGFEAVKWCINYGWVQQGYTLLQETLISYILWKNDLNWELDINRCLVNRCSRIICKQTPPDQWSEIEKSNYIVANRLVNSEVTQQSSKLNRYLGDLRNDMNHAGNRPNPSSTKVLKTKLPKIYNEIMNLIGIIEGH